VSVGVGDNFAQHSARVALLPHTLQSFDAVKGVRATAPCVVR
jgi:hypothetical protein